MPAYRTTTTPAAGDQQLPSVISDTSVKTFEWDGNPLTRPVWLSTLPAQLQEDKTIRDLFEKSWVLTSSGKVAVESATHARYISLYPDLFFEWDDPAPPFNEDLYEARRLSIMQILDKWYASKSSGEVPPFTKGTYSKYIISDPNI